MSSRDDEDSPLALEKPSRRTSKRLTIVNNIFAWIAIGSAIWIGQEMASAIVPLMATLIASLLGIYQGVGHFDLRTMARMRAKKFSERESDA